MLQSRVTAAVLMAAALFSSLLAWDSLRAYHLPGNHQGFQPDQPIAFSHRLHAGEMGISCNYCHAGAERSRAAGIPSANTCMNCHRFVSAPSAEMRAEDKAAAAEGRKPRMVVSPEIRKIYASLGLSDSLEPASEVPAAPLEWVRVHQLPDFAYFDHRPHVGAGLACQQCHGPVETMEKVRQEANLSMGWCMSCHRTSQVPQEPGQAPRKPSIDCSSCHY